MSETDKPFTRGWRIAIAIALVFALGNTGVSSLRRQEEQHFRNHEKRIDELEAKIRDLERDRGNANAPPAGKD